MIKVFSVLMSICLLIGCSGQKQSSAFDDRVRDFDADWHFIKDSVAGAEQPGFDDSKWRVLDLPHDWSIEDLPEQIPGKISCKKFQDSVVWHHPNFFHH